jgi:glycogen debranching enzyme
MKPVLPFNGLPVASLAAGLPHFSTEYCRCWGRDIFIALRGLLLIPGHHEEARMHLLAFGSVVKHGLVPNLLDMGNKPRFNARDATWFWLNSVFDYCEESEEGYGFLNALVARRFVPPRKYTTESNEFDKNCPEFDDVDQFILFDHPNVYRYSSTVAQICHEILERHIQGISFREWNAGPSLDHAMRPEGFDIQIGVDLETGFVFGGNRWNCGTWMDKMGDSEAANTKGTPATPRDGSAVELIGLQKRVLRCINSLLKKKDARWPWELAIFKKGYETVKLDDILERYTYLEWESTIQTHFENHYYIPSKKEDDLKYKITTQYVNRRGIYKDVLGSSLPFCDYQLRPNVCIAMIIVL